MDQVGKGAMVNEEEIGANKGGILTKGSPPSFSCTDVEKK